MNLPIHQQVAMEAMPEPAKKFIYAKFLEPKASELPVKQMEVEIVTLITNLLVDAGYKDSQDKTVIIHLSTRVNEDMKTRYKHLTLTELKMALNSGVRGDYGQFMGINITTINNWIKAFETCELRKMAIIDYNARLSLPIRKSDPSKEEQYKLVADGLKQAIELFKKDGTMPPASNCHVFFNHLKKRGELNITDEERDGYWKKAQEIVKTNLNNRRGTITQAEYQEALGRLEKGTEVQRKAKELVFKDYLNKMGGKR